MGDEERPLNILGWRCWDFCDPRNRREAGIGIGRRQNRPRGSRLSSPAVEVERKGRKFFEKQAERPLPPRLPKPGLTSLRARRVQRCGAAGRGYHGAAQLLTCGLGAGGVRDGVHLQPVLGGVQSAGLTWS